MNKPKTNKFKCNSIQTYAIGNRLCYHIRPRSTFRSAHGADWLTKFHSDCAGEVLTEISLYLEEKCGK